MTSDSLLVPRDTNSCLSTIPAKRLHAPIFRMEAGNCCCDERLSEEANRCIVDVIFDVIVSTKAVKIVQSYAASSTGWCGGSTE